MRRFEPLPIPGAWHVRPDVFADERGTFVESFAESWVLECTGRAFHVAQVNVSTSALGVIRGIHYADVPPGQAKYVTCVRGAIYDVVVDLRQGSPTFGAWHGVQLQAEARDACLISEGLGHAFLALAEDTVVSYLCSTAYAPEREHTVDPLDPELAIAWPAPAGAAGWTLSARDRAAASFADARRAGTLPIWHDIRA